MYTALMFIMIGFGLWMVVNGASSRRIPQVVAGGFLAVGTAAFFWFMGFWGEMLWFDALGYDERFWDVFWVRLLAGAAGVVFSAGLVYLLTLGYSAQKLILRYGAVLLGALIGLSWGMANWENILRFIYAAPTELREPIFGKTVGFYLFRLPMLDAIKNLLFLLSLISLAAATADAYLEFNNSNEISIQPHADAHRINAVYRAAAVFFIVMAFSMFLKRYHLMYSDIGPIKGPGWTDVHIRLPAMIFMIVVMLTAAVALLLSPLRRFMLQRFSRHTSLFAAVAMTVVGLQTVSLFLVPSAFQQLRVEPNEITFEKPYIAHNIKFTRHGFKLTEVEEKEYPVSDRFLDTWFSVILYCIDDYFRIYRYNN